MDEKRGANVLGAFVYASHDAVSMRIAQKCGLSGAAPGALVLIGNCPGKSEKFLSIALGLSHSGTVRLIDKFAQDRLIERRRALDGVPLFLMQSLKFGLALHLGFLRMSGQPLDAVRVVPAALWRHLGMTLGVNAPDLASLRAMYGRGRTLLDHQQLACEALGN